MRPSSITDHIRSIISSMATSGRSSIISTPHNERTRILTNGAGGGGTDLLFSDGQNRTLNAGESLLHFYDGGNWRPIEGTATTQTRFVGTITTSEAPFNSLPVVGLTSQAHCTYSPTNALASTLASRGTYVTVLDGAVRLNHMPLPEATFDFFCSVN